MSKYAVINPANGETVKEYPEITDEELSAAIAAATNAHRNWGMKTSIAERAALVKQVAELHTERREALAEIIVLASSVGWMLVQLMQACMVPNCGSFIWTKLGLTRYSVPPSGAKGEFSEQPKVHSVSEVKHSARRYRPILEDLISVHLLSFSDSPFSWLPRFCFCIAVCAGWVPDSTPAPAKSMTSPHNVKCNKG